jgi:RNA recognition motif-containing protein
VSLSSRAKRNAVVAAAQPVEGVQAMGRKLYVGNLGFDVNNKDLEELFAQAGACESVAVITDRETGQSRGFGFVEMGSNGEAQKAIQQFNGQEFKGRALKVNEAKERENNRGGGGRGRY